MINISTDKNIENAIVYNTLGQEMISLHGNTNSLKMDISSLFQSICFVKIDMSGRSETVSVIKKLNV